MSVNQIHEYFNREPENWNILTFLEECKLALFKQKGTDYANARKWKKEAKPVNGPSVHFHKITGSSVITINNGLLDVEEEIPPLKNIVKCVPPTSEKWAQLPSGQGVKDIFSKNVSQLAKSTKDKETLTAIEKATLRYSVSRIIDLSAHMQDWFSDEELEFMKEDYKTILKVPDLEEEVNIFITEVEKMVWNDPNKAYKFCMERQINSEVNTCIYKISKIYGDFLYEVKDGTDMLDSGDETHTEVDIIVKATSYIVKALIKGLKIYYKWGESFCPLSRSANFERVPMCDVRFLSSSSVDLGEWEFAVHASATKSIGDRCRSARVNQSILNGILNLNLTDNQAKIAKVPFLQIAGTYGQMLLEDLVNGFYCVFPGASFELPTKLSQIHKLRQTVKIFKYVLETYDETSKILDELDHG
ncbi:4879_t:CDS:2 [Funneliformis mosseae]|uniref:4879_t:CDS:1 n=1 Tax=Funneliformis mosseae TaxID=27381 RepID=A0A9N9F7S9_FUNMO|nr:4879_t:CDS:2 [Funneliformis mosseae]